jgi:hypothetical protein
MKSFWNKVSIKNDRECWEWMAAKQPNGYGKFAMWNGKLHNFLSHRLAWMLWHGEDPGGLLVLHKCDNRGCVNPGHLFLGTHRDNIMDKIAKGRDHNTRKTHCKHGHEFVGDNLFITNRGTRECNICRRRLMKKAKKKYLAKIDGRKFL